MTKVTIIDGSQGWILEQHLYDARRRLLAKSVASGHRRDPLTSLVMPTVVEINCPPAQLAMRIDLGNVEINRLSGDPAALWSMPSYPNAPLVDMADPKSWPPASPAQAAATTRRTAPPPEWRQPDAIADHCLGAGFLAGGFSFGVAFSESNSRHGLWAW